MTVDAARDNARAYVEEVVMSKRSNLVYVVLTALLMCFGSFVMADSPRLRVLLVSDTLHSALGGRDDLSEPCAVAVEVWRFLFAGGFPEQEGTTYTIDVLDGENASPGRIRDYYTARLEFLPGDRLFFYYCGHGATDQGGLGHYLSMGRGNILRSEVRTLMLGKGPPAAFIFTDACSDFQKVELTPAAPQPSFSHWPELFLRPTGVVDITAAAPGELAWFTDAGGIFTNALTTTLTRSKESIDLNRDNVLTWAEVYQSLRRDTNEEMAMRKATMIGGHKMAQSRSQTAAYFFLEQWPQYLKYIHVQNVLNEAVTISMHYFTINGQNAYQWFPHDPQVNAQGISWQVPAQTQIRLDRAINVPLLAHAVQWSVTTSSGLQKGPFNETLAPSGGYSGEGDRPSAHQIIIDSRLISSN